MNPTEIKPPEGHEILTSEILRKYGAVEGMKYNILCLKDDRWHDWTSPTFCYDEKATRDVAFSAPLGTTALVSTPLPKLRCDCGASHHREHINYNEHDTRCPAHPHNRRVHVLPGWLAKCKEKPEGLEIAHNTDKKWMSVPSDAIWYNWLMSLASSISCHFAYSIPLSVWEKIEAERKEKSYSPFEDTPEYHESIAGGGSVVAPENVPTASGPTDGELWTWAESHADEVAEILRTQTTRAITFDSNGIKKETLSWCPTLRAAIQNAMKERK